MRYRAFLIAAMLAVVAACGDNDPDATTTTSTAPAGTAEAGAAGATETETAVPSATPTEVPVASATPTGLLDELVALASGFTPVDVWGDAAGEVRFVTPNGMTIDDEGSVYVTDFQFGQLTKLNPDGTLVFRTGEEGPFPGQLAGPIGVAVASDGSILVSESGVSRVSVFEADGTFRTTFGGDGTDPGLFRSAMGIAISEQGEVFVSDFGNHRVQVFSGTGDYLRGWGESGDGDGQFNNPIGLQIGPAGNVWVVDSGNERVQVFTQAGELVRVLDDVGAGPQIISLNDAGEFYVASPWAEARVRHFSADGELLGYLGYSATDAELDRMTLEERQEMVQFDRLDGPHGTATGPDGAVYVADTANSVVRKFEPVEG